MIRLKSFENPALELISHPVVVSNLDEARVFSRTDRLTVARVTLPATIGHWIYVLSKDGKRKRYTRRIERKKRSEKEIITRTIGNFEWKKTGYLIGNGINNR